MIAVVIPCYKVAAHICALIPKIGSDVDAIFIVDDCCPEKSGALVEANCADPRVRVIYHTVNQGVGGAVLSGYRAAIAAGAEVIVKVDGDGQMDPALIPAFVAPILRGEADVVMGSRFLLQKPHFFTKQGDPFFSHYIGNILIIRLTNLLYGFHATDYEGCYKAFSRRVIQETPVTTNGFDFDNELICKLLRRGRRIVEVPIHYTPRPYAQGKKIRWQHGLQMLWAIVKWRIARL